MELNEYKIMYSVEDNYWWYVGLRKLVISFIETYNEKRDHLKILDAGVGTGKMLNDINAYNVYGMDYSEEAIRYCKLRKLKNLVKGSVDSVPFKESSFNIIISLDVLYHKGVKNDVDTLKEFFRVMHTSGVLILNLPAYNMLQSIHDEAVYTRERYTKKVLTERLQKAGFEVESITYRNTILFPIAIIVRLFQKIFLINRKKATSDLIPLPRLLNKLFTSILLLENSLIASGVNFPFGLSIYCVARKK